MNIEFQASAYLRSYTDIKDILNGKEMPAISHGDSEYFAKEGYPKIGNVRVIIEIMPKDAIVKNQIDALKAQLQTVRADNHRKESAILDKISKLQALTFDEADE